MRLPPPARAVGGRAAASVISFTGMTKRASRATDDGGALDEDLALRMRGSKLPRSSRLAVRAWSKSRVNYCPCNTLFRSHWDGGLPLGLLLLREGDPGPPLSLIALLLHLENGAEIR